MTCGIVKKKKIDGQSAAKGPCERIKVQRLDQVDFSFTDEKWKGPRVPGYPSLGIRYSPTLCESIRSIG